MFSTQVQSLKQFCDARGVVIDDAVASSASTCIVLDVVEDRLVIAYASQGFLDLTGHRPPDLQGKDLRVLHGPATTESYIQDIALLISEGREGPINVVHYATSGVPFLDQLFLSPLRNAAGIVQLYLASQGALGGEESTTASVSNKSSGSLDEMLEEEEGEDDPAIAACVTCTVPDPRQTALKIAVLDPSLTRTTAVYYPNTGELIPFDTPAFKGVVHCRTRNPGDTYFLGKKRAFEIQVQGQFKRPPKGVVWFGAEVTRPMTLSRMKRMICGVLLKLVAAFGHRAHVSFAEQRIPGDVPHIACPALSAMDRVIITPPGGVPPTLGSNFPLTEGMAAIKALHSQPEDFLVGHTYTMTFFSHYIDFERWAVVEIPGVGSVDLHSFWADMPLRFVCYAHPADQQHHLVQERDPLVQFEIVHRSLPRYQELPIPSYAPAAAPRRPHGTPTGRPASTRW
jgi:hypothetical protein